MADGRWTQTRRVYLRFLPDALDEGDEQFALILESDLRGGIVVVDATPRGSDTRPLVPGTPAPTESSSPSWTRGWLP